MIRFSLSFKLWQYKRTVKVVKTRCWFFGFWTPVIISNDRIEREKWI